jgi:hypothetical protein
VPPDVPPLDESKYFKLIVEFRSGTPPLTLWASHLHLTSELLELESEIDGKAQRGLTIRRSGISHVSLDFDAPFQEPPAMFPTL